MPATRPVGEPECELLATRSTAPERISDCYSHGVPSMARLDCWTRFNSAKGYWFESSRGERRGRRRRPAREADRPVPGISFWCVPIPHGATGVVVVGETPYAEGFGDVNGPQWAYDPGDHNVPRPVKDMQLSAADKTAIDKVCSAAAKCIVVVVS